MDKRPREERKLRGSRPLCFIFPQRPFTARPERSEHPVWGQSQGQGQRQRQGWTRWWQQQRPAKHQGSQHYQQDMQHVQHFGRVPTDILQISTRLQSYQERWQNVLEVGPQRRQPRVINSVELVPKRQNCTFLMGNIIPK